MVKRTHGKECIFYNSHVMDEKGDLVFLRTKYTFKLSDDLEEDTNSFVLLLLIKASTNEPTFIYTCEL